MMRAVYCRTGRLAYHRLASSSTLSPSLRLYGSRVTSSPFTGRETKPRTPHIHQCTNALPVPIWSRYCATTAEGEDTPVESDQLASLRGFSGIATALEASGKLDVAPYTKVLRLARKRDRETATRVFRHLRSLCPQSELGPLYATTISVFCQRGDAEAVELLLREVDECQEVIEMPLSIQKDVLAMHEKNMEALKAINYVEKLREAGDPLHPAWLAPFTRFLAKRGRAVSLNSLLTDIAGHRKMVVGANWAVLVPQLLAALQMINRDVGEEAVSMLKAIERLMESQRPLVADFEAVFATSHRRLVDLYMDHNAPADAARLMAKALISNQNGPHTPSSLNVLAYGMSKAVDSLLESNRLPVVVHLFHTVLDASQGTQLPPAMANLSLKVLKAMKSHQDQLPRGWGQALTKSILPAVVDMRVRGTEATKAVDRSLLHCLSLSQSLSPEPAANVFQQVMSALGTRRQVHCGMLKALIYSASRMPTLDASMEAMDSIAALRINYFADQTDVGVSMLVYDDLDGNEMVKVNKACMQHYYWRAFELAARRTHNISPEMLKFLLYLLRELEANGVSDVLPQGVQPVQVPEDAIPPAPEHLLAKESLAPIHPAIKRPACRVTAWDYRNLLVVARKAEHVDACAYLTSMAHSNGVLGSVIGSLPAQVQDMTEYVQRGLEKRQKPT